MQKKLSKHDIVLLGVGHTNAHILKMWRMSPIPNASLTCISNFSVATYSGMLPGVLAGQYEPAEMEIDLVRLCEAAGARLICGDVTGVDVQQQAVQFKSRPPIPFDVLSIGIGSVPTPPPEGSDPSVLVKIKPMQTFLERLEGRVAECVANCGDRPIRVVVVGAGAGGVEICLCLSARLKMLAPSHEFQLALVNGSEDIISGAVNSTRRRVLNKLKQHDIELETGKRVREVSDSTLHYTDGSQREADIVLWATGATAAPLLSAIDLPSDERGFLLTDDTLQTTAKKPIFAVGDSGTLANNPTPKAGVYAVRQGPILWENLQRQIRGETLTPYRPQSGFLQLLNTGDGQAIAQYKGVSLQGKWALKLKDYIDVKFMKMYQDYAIPKMASVADEPEDTVMRCAGCGGKVSGTVLSNVLKRLEIPPHPQVVLGLDKPDDVAILQPQENRPQILTTDFFAAPLDDPYLAGRIGALNALSDAFAVGARPVAALATITIPEGPYRKQEELLFQLLSGGLEEIKAAGATLAGGHTIESEKLTIGFTVVADAESRSPQTKDKLKEGDKLILTKPLGSGILLAAHMRAECEAAWFDDLVQTMLLPNSIALPLLDKFDVHGLTDVTGFGFAGHMLEMLRASDVSAHIELDSIPLITGTDSLVRAGVESTLAPANRLVEDQIERRANVSGQPKYQALFDPQTCGGLLLGVDPSDVDAVLEEIERLQGAEAFCVGTVVAKSDRPKLVVV